jgi:hypothetical protein
VVAVEPKVVVGVVHQGSLLLSGDNAIPSK